MKKLSIQLTCMISIIFAFGCHRDAPEPSTPSAEVATGPRTYTLKGVVRKVEPGSGEVTIAHEAMPGFMGAMVMPFVVKDRSSLDDLQPGDEVEGPLRVTFDGGKVLDYELSNLIVTRPSVAKEGGMTAGTIAPGPLRVGDPVPDFAVTTQDGAVLRLSDLRGRVVALTFIYTRCPLPDFCPALDGKFAELARRVGTVPGRAEDVRLLSISFDPEHDTPEVLRRHARLRGARPPLWTFAVASHDELAKVAGPLGLEYAPVSGSVVHNRVAAVIGPDGRLVALEGGRAWTPEELFRAIQASQVAIKGGK